VQPNANPSAGHRRVKRRESHALLCYRCRHSPPAAAESRFADSRLPIPDSRFPIPDSRFPIPDSRFPMT